MPWEYLSLTLFYPFYKYTHEAHPSRNEYHMKSGFKCSSHSLRCEGVLRFFFWKSSSFMYVYIDRAVCACVRACVSSCCNWWCCCCPPPSSRVFQKSLVPPALCEEERASVYLHAIPTPIVTPRVCGKDTDENTQNTPRINEIHKFW